MRFSGDFRGSSFHGLEAESLSALLEALDPTATASKDDMRCWMRIMKGNSQAERWVEVFLDIPDYFASLCRFVSNPEEIQVIFRGHEQSLDPLLKGLDVTATTLEDSFTGNDSFSVPNNNNNVTILSEDAAATSLLVEDLDISQATNFWDPITNRKIEQLGDPFLIVFYSKKFQSEDSKTLCVSKSALESYVACALNDGHDIIRLKIAHNVSCRDGKKRSFSLTPIVWVQSLLPNSRTLSQLFRKAAETTLQRNFQLTNLSEDEDLWDRVCFWLSDMLSFHDRALKRMSYHGESPSEDALDTPPFMSGFYFTPSEARNLGKIVMSNGTYLQDLLQNFADLHDDSDAQHDFGVQLCQSFQLDDEFPMDTVFKQQKAKWIRERQQDLLGYGYGPSFFD